MIAELIGLIALISIVVFFLWRISVKNQTLYESTIFRTFIPIGLLFLIGTYVLIVVLKYNPIESMTTITSVTLLTAGLAYVQMPVDSKNFFAHLLIANYDLAPKGKWIELHSDEGIIIGKVVALMTSAVTLRDEEGAVYTVETQSYLRMKPRRLGITANSDNTLNIYLYRVDVALPFDLNVDYMSIKQNIKTRIIEQQLSTYATDDTGINGEVIDKSAMTGFVYDDLGTHISPRVYFGVPPPTPSSLYVQFVILIPCLDYYEGWSKWHSYIGKLSLQCYREHKQG